MQNAEACLWTCSTPGQCRSTKLKACVHQQQRNISIDQHGQPGEELSERDYHRLADLTLGELLAKLEDLIESTSALADADLEYSQVPYCADVGMSA